MPDCIVCNPPTEIRCRTHQYQADRRAQRNKAARRRAAAARRELKSQGAFTMRMAIEDWMSLDGGWHSQLSLSADLGYNPDRIARTLRDMRDEGLVESRLVQLASTSKAGSGGWECRTEWRCLN